MTKKDAEVLEDNVVPLVGRSRTRKSGNGTFSLAEAIKRNAELKKKLQAERLLANDSVLKAYRIRKKQGGGARET